MPCPGQQSDRNVLPPGLENIRETVAVEHLVILTCHETQRLLHCPDIGPVVMLGSEVLL